MVQQLLCNANAPCSCEIAAVLKGCRPLEFQAGKKIPVQFAAWKILTPLLESPFLQVCFLPSPQFRITILKNHKSKKSRRIHGHVNCCLGQNPSPKGTEFSFFSPCKMLDVLPGGKFTGSWDTPHRDQPTMNLPETSFDVLSALTLGSLLNNDFCEFIACWKQNSISFHLT